jgi:predicted RNA-binding Zn-ribbon protein involved in translation (DUF1610 family)
VNWLQRLMIRLGLPPYKCPECGERMGEWTKPAQGRSYLTGRPVGVFGRGWTCDECGWRT